MSNIQSGSRRNTPWTGKSDATALQKFIDGCNHDNYNRRHPNIKETREIGLLNSYKPDCCKKCSSRQIKVHGYTNTGLRRYKCRDCGCTFTIITGTIFDQRKIPITEWLDFLLLIFGHGSFNMASKSNRNAYNTTKFWIDKLFLLLQEWQSGIMLSGIIYLDETYYSVRSDDMYTKDNGKKPRGLSKNKLCIGTAWDGRNLICFQEGTGKPSSKETLKVFSRNIRKGSEVIHDGDNSHRKLIASLGHSETIYTTKETKGLKDADNPLNPINQQHRMLKRFLNAHSGFKREQLQDYLNLFSFISSEPVDMYEKIELLLNLALRSSKILRYRAENTP